MTKLRGLVGQTLYPVPPQITSELIRQVEPALRDVADDAVYAAILGEVWSVQNQIGYAAISRLSQSAGPGIVISDS